VKVLLKPLYAVFEQRVFFWEREFLLTDVLLFDCVQIGKELVVKHDK
jgi:hypothetical protein